MIDNVLNVKCLWVMILQVTSENNTLAVQSKATHFSRPGSAYAFRSPIGYSDPKMVKLLPCGSFSAMYKFYILPKVCI